MKATFEIEISNVEVDDEYYTFNYAIKKDGVLLEEGEINDDYQNGMTPADWKEFIEAGWGADKALMQVLE